MDPVKIIQKYYKVNSKAYKILVTHSELVVKKALEIAKNVPELKPDSKFIQEAAMLHDIGVYLTDAQEIGCFGDKPYLAHGYLGRDILERENLPKHALVCERHVGVGISRREIIDNKLPLPARDMNPVTIEEEIISLADKFFTKDTKQLTKEKSIEGMITGQEEFGQKKTEKLKQRLKKFGVEV